MTTTAEVIALRLLLAYDDDSEDTVVATLREFLSSAWASADVILVLVDLVVTLIRDDPTWRSQMEAELTQLLDELADHDSDM